MFEKLTKLAVIFEKTASEDSEDSNDVILAPGQSTLKPEDAFAIGARALEALNQIQPELLQAYPHENFRRVSEQLASGELPDIGARQLAVNEFSGLKAFSNMVSIPFADIMRAEYV